ncbi:hypothetical protein MKEN_00488200 [Mycena kentingensis (nom. inval.)]|nr:hypothetical protein MKEN_00488200 [Mycena kentingensis (nom. inval.)]
MAKSKAQKARAEGMRATLEMVKKTGKHTYDAIRDSPKKLSRLLTSPARKRLRPSSPHETSPVRYRIKFSFDPADCKNKDTDHNLSDTSIGAYENLRPWHIEISIPDASEPTQDQPEDTARTLHSKWTPPRTDKHRNDASPKGCSFFSLSGPPSSPPRGAAVSHTFKWKPATVEDAADDDAGSDVPSVATFPMPEPPELFSTPPTPPMPCSLPEIDRGEYAYGYGHDESDVKSDAVSIPEERAETPPSSACPSPVPSEELDYMDEEMSEEELAEFEAELKAQRSEIEVGSGDYPRPPCEDAGLRAAAGSGPDADGVHRRAPALADAREALKSAKTALRGELRGDPTWVGTRGVGYKPLVLDDFSRARLWGIRALLSLYTDENSLTHGHWGDSMLQAAIAMGRGKHCAREIAVLARQFIYDREILELNPYGKWTESMLMDEDLLNEIKLFLQSLGTEITAEKLRLYLCDPEVKRRHGIERDICHATACRYLHELGYRFSSPKVGQFVDGHERPDVVEYRDTIYLPAYFSYQDRVWVHNDDGNIENPPLGPRRVIFWYHDESVFYAHDRRRKTWVHKESTAKPYKKGEGYSYIVADYFSADFGWLKCPWTGRSARVSIKPGANRDGYFTNVEVREQARTAVALVKEIWPNYEHIFVYDNAPNHRKRPDDALSALNMPRAPSGSSAKFPDANLMGKRKKQAPDGTYVHDAHGKVEMEDVPMTEITAPPILLLHHYGTAKFHYCTASTDYCTVLEIVQGALYAFYMCFKVLARYN